MIYAVTLLAQASSNPPPPAPIGGSGDWLVWGVVLMAVAVALFFVEVFLPTGGVVGGLSGAAAIAGVVMLFRVDSTLGLIAALLCLLALPFMMVFALKVWPDTPFARWVTLENEEADEAPSVRGDEPASEAGPAVGDTGKTLTPLFPVGTCLLGGRRRECLARRGTIDAGAEVRVVRVKDNEVYVEAVASEHGT